MTLCLFTIFTSLKVEMEGIVFASKMNGFEPLLIAERSNDMHSSHNPSDKRSESTTSLETIIALGLFGWLALSMTLMGLGIW